MKSRHTLVRTKVFLIMVSFFVCILAGNVYIAQAITNGVPDGGNHPYVVLIVLGNEDGNGWFEPYWRCTGSLIAPDVILTAGHCTDGVSEARVWLGEGPIDSEAQHVREKRAIHVWVMLQVFHIPTMITVVMRILMGVAMDSRHSPIVMWESSF